MILCVKAIFVAAIIMVSKFKRVIREKEKKGAEVLSHNF